MNTQGLQRPASASINKYHYTPMMVNVDRYPSTIIPSAVSYSAAAANQKYLDKDDDNIQVVCGGTPKLFTVGLGILKDDTKDGELGSYVIYGVHRLPIKSTDTPAIGDFLYWDDTNKYLTTTAGGNSKSAVCLEAYASWVSGSAVLPSSISVPVVSGRKWGVCELRPML